MKSTLRWLGEQLGWFLGIAGTLLLPLVLLPLVPIFGLCDERLGPLAGLALEHFRRPHQLSHRVSPPMPRTSSALAPRMAHQRTARKPTYHMCSVERLQLAVERVALANQHVPPPPGRLDARLAEHVQELGSGITGLSRDHGSGLQMRGCPGRNAVAGEVVTSPIRPHVKLSGTRWRLLVAGHGTGMSLVCEPDMAAGERYMPPTLDDGPGACGRPG